MPTVLHTVGWRAPKKSSGLGLLRPTLGNTVGTTTPFSDRYPVEVLVHRLFRALYGRLKLTVRRHRLKRDSPLSQVLLLYYSQARS